MKNQNELNVLAISGSLRSDSFNRKLLQIAKSIATEFGANVRELDLKLIELPMFNVELRLNDFPESVKKMKKEIEWADVLLIATPEYNNSIPGPLKNAIDWASDVTNAFSGKIAAIFGASTGMFGTLRSQLHLRQVLTSLNVELIPQPQVYISFADKAFHPDGSLIDQKYVKQLRTLIEKTFKFAYLKKSSVDIT